MIVRLLIIIFVILSQLNSFGQSDSLWNVMILKKENRPEMKDNMAEFSTTGFYLFRNCFYDLQLNDKSKKTLRLIDIKPDTLIFIGISSKKDNDLTEIAKDTFIIDYKSIDNLLLLRNWGSEASKKVKCDDYYFIFHKSSIANRLDSKLARIFPDFQSEIVPRLSSFGISYHYEFDGKLYYHSGMEVKIPKYNDKDKEEILNGVVKVLDLIVNKRLNVTIHR